MSKFDIGRDSDDDCSTLDFLKLRNNKIPKFIWIIMYILGSSGVILVGISLGCMFYNPINEQEYLNNIQLSESIKKWEKQDLAENFKSYKMQLAVKSYSSERKLERLQFQTVDPHFNLTHKPGYFEKVFKNNLLEFGIFEFEQFNVPIGNSADYCLQLKYYDKVKKLIYHNIAFQSIINEPYCTVYSTNKYDSQETTGVNITPWKQTKTPCKECTCAQGIIQNIDGQQFCFQYEILVSICLVVKEKQKRIEFVSGCYKNNNYQIFRSAQIHEKNTFEDLTLEVREIRDPYITALTLSQNDLPIQFEDANFPSIIRLLFEIGFGLIVFTIMLNLSYKSNRSPSANLRRTRINSIIYLKDQ